MRSVNGSWLCNEIGLGINSLKQYSFIVGVVIGDNHSSDVNAFSKLTKNYGDSVQSVH